MAVLPTGIGPVTGGGTPENAISRSLRFNSLDSAHLTRTLSSSGNRKKWTMSVWQKGFVSSRNGGNQNAFLSVGTGSNIGDYRANIVFNAENFYFAYVQIQTAGIISATATPVYRDPSAWYHFMCVFDSDNATLNDRVRLYVNGSRVDASVTCPQGQQTDINNSSYQHKIGILQDYTGNPTYYADMFLAEQYFVDGQNLLPSDFGETGSATGIWKPKPYTGTYGTNGFYLNFSDNSGTTSTTLGKDNSGNGNNWTPNNFSVTAGVNNDSMVDSPTAYGTDTGVGGEVRGNYCTWNPLDKNSNGSLVNGNLDNSNGSANNAGVRSTFDLPSSDKWYAELRVNTTTSGSVALGFGFATSTADLAGSVDSANKYDIYGSSSGYIFSNTSTITSSLGAFSSGDILQVAYDGATGKAWLGKNNTWYNSTGGTTGNPGAGTNQTFTLTGQFFLYSYYYNVSGSLNCGQRAFAYTAPSGFKALCTQNLPTPAIAKGNQYFDVLTWSGTGGSSGATRSITGLNFQPDFLWEKARSSGSGHQLLDVVRGVGQNKVLASNSTGAEPTPANTESLYGWLSSFNSDGFTTTNGTSTWDNWNKSGDTYVAWNWKAGGTGVTNTTGTITSTVSANTTAGFSIVVYTGNGIDGATVGHGLGVVPSMVIQKRRDGSIANFRVWHSAIYATSGVTDTLFLNSTAASGPDGDNISGVSSTTFTTRGTGGTNPSGNSCVAYVFAAVPGYSAFGKYTGNGSADGSFIYLGFRPEFVIIKRTDSTGNWITYDAVRGTYNVNGPYVYSNSSATEATSTTVGLDFLSNGFKNRNTYNDANTSSATYIYMAFAENPFKYSLAR